MTDQEINEAVARKLGWEKNEALPDITGLGRPNFAHWWRDGEISSCAVPANYSTDIAAAWEIVEHVAKSKYPAVIYRDLDFPWGCKIDDIEAWADTAPMAICKAFLKLEEK